jgi:hypothetical protein
MIEKKSFDIHLAFIPPPEFCFTVELVKEEDNWEFAVCLLFFGMFIQFPRRKEAQSGK